METHSIIFSTKQRGFLVVLSVFIVSVPLFLNASTASIPPSNSVETISANPNVQFLLKPQFETVKNFNQKLAPATSNGKWGFITENGRWQIDPQFTETRPFVENKAAVKKNGKWSYVNKNGRTIAPFKFNQAGNFSNGTARVKPKNRWGLINDNGEYLVKPKYQWLGKRSESKFAAMKNGTVGYINQYDTVLIDFKFYNGKPFSNGIAPVKTNKHWQFINESGTVVSPHKFKWASPGTGNTARVLHGDTWKIFNQNDYSLKKAQGTIIYPFSNNFSKFKRNGKVGYVNKTGTTAIEAKFSNGLSFHQNLAPVQKNGKWGFITTNGNWLVKPVFDLAGSFHNGVAPVKISGKWGFLKLSDPELSNPDQKNRRPPRRQKGTHALRYISKFIPGEQPRWALEIHENPRRDSPASSIWEVTRYPYQEPTILQIDNAKSLITSSLKAAKRKEWFNFTSAKQAGFYGNSKTHYMHKKFSLDNEILNPAKPESLMYYPTDGEKKLAGFMFLTDSIPDQGPQVGGPLTRWHYHIYDKPHCYIFGVLPPKTEKDCRFGRYSRKTPEMLHVWFVDHPISQFAIRMHTPSIIVPKLERKNFPPALEKLLNSF